MTFITCQRAHVVTNPFFVLKVVFATTGIVTKAPFSWTDALEQQIFMSSTLQTISMWNMEEGPKVHLFIPVHPEQ